MIDQNTPGGRALQAVVKNELKTYLGQDYDDDVLPLYIVVMLAHGNEQPLVKDNLDAFLGDEKSALFAEWLFKHLAENLTKYDASAAKSQQGAPPTGLTAADKEENERKRRKREKIEWKGEEPAKPVARERDERQLKRRKSDEPAPRLESSSGRDREGARDPVRDRDRFREPRRERSPLRRNEVPPQRYGERYHSRYEPRDQEPRYTQRDRREAEDLGYDNGERVHDRRGGRDTARNRRQSSSSPRRDKRKSSRLAGRLGRMDTDQNSKFHRPSASPIPSPVREEVKPSVFDRLQRRSRSPAKVSLRRPPVEAAHQDGQHINGSSLASKSRMRMDDVPDSKAVEQPAESPLAQQAAALQAKVLAQPSQSLDNQDKLASELRQIRESLAKLQAEKAKEAEKEVANLAARRAVVQNVHFNATPEIIKAHFSGCGSVVSAVIEKEATGKPKGVAIIEFETEEARSVALTLSGSLLLGRPITVLAKEPTFSHISPPFQARHMDAGGFRPRAPMHTTWGRGRAPGRGPFGARPTLKKNKYIRPTVDGAAQG